VGGVGSRSKGWRWVGLGVGLGIRGQRWVALVIFKMGGVGSGTISLFVEFRLFYFYS